MRFLGVDCGTSALKAVLVDEQRARRSRRRRAPTCRSGPQPLWSEQDPDVWRDAMFGALAELRAAAPEDWRRVRALGFSGQMHGLVALGRRRPAGAARDSAQ